MSSSILVHALAVLLFISAIAQTPFPTEEFPLLPPSSPPPPSPFAPFSGLTFSQCFASSSSCVPPRTCTSGVFRDEQLLPCKDTDGLGFCACLPPRTVLCTQDQDCPEGEECFKFPTLSQRICAAGFLDFILLGRLSPLPTLTPQFTGTGLTREPCEEDADCLFPRTCTGTKRNGREVGEGESVPQPFPVQLSGPTESRRCDAPDCACYPPSPQRCSKSAECVSGEVCVALPALIQFCASAAMEGRLLQLGEVAPLTRGWTLDVCTDDDDCRGSRECVFLEVNRPVEACGSRDGCRCLPQELSTCRSRRDCRKGEVCGWFALLPGSAGLIFPKELPQEQLVDEENPNSVKISPFCASRSIAFSDFVLVVSTDLDRKGLGYNSQGLTLESCRGHKNCQGKRNCRRLGFPSLFNVCSESENCPPIGVCVPDDVQTCSADMNCEDGEVCAVFGTGDPFCVSAAVADVDDNLIRADTIELQSPEPISESPPAAPDASPVSLLDGISPDEEDALVSPSPELVTSDERVSVVCVDAKALANLRPEELVFEKDSMANVLCDPEGSCATNGHMVVFRGVAMMMGRYCEMVGCNERVMRVNSPRYRRGIRLTSNTEGLQYTAFAARYSTRAEEVVLRSVIHAGL